MPCHWSLCFLLSPCYLQDAMPGEWSPSDLLQVLQIWESVFYSQAFFALHSFLLLSRPPWGRQFTLKVSRASCWSAKHSYGPTICLNHSNQQNSYTNRLVFKVYGWSAMWIICSSRDLNSLLIKLNMLRVLCFIHLATEPHSLQ